MKYLLLLLASCVLSCACASAQCMPNPPNYVGPPFYPCGSTTVANPGPIVAPFSSSSPVNATAEDTTIPGHIAGTYIITRANSPAITPSNRSVGNNSISGGANDWMWSRPNGQFVWTTLTGSNLQLLQVDDTSQPYAQIVNSTCTSVTFQSGGAFSTSAVSDRTYYYFVDGAKTGSKLMQGTISGSGCGVGGLSVSSVALFDFMAVDACPGITPFNISTKSVLTISNDDDKFIVSLAAGSQGSGHWTFSFSRTRGCSTVDWDTNNVWAYCTSSCSSAAPLGTMPMGAGNCGGSNSGSSLGIHEELATQDGRFAFATPTYPWGTGGCAGIASTQGGIAVWEVGTVNNQWCANQGSGSVFKCGAHASPGVSKYISPSSAGWSIRDASLVSSFTQFLTDPGENQLHGSWPHNNNGVYDDSLPYITTSSDASAAQKSGCNANTQAPYCPNYAQNVIMIGFPSVAFPPGQLEIIAHNFTCSDAGGELCADGIADGFGPGQAISTISPKGDMLAFPSTMLHNLGTDNGGAPLASLFIVYLGAPQGGATSTGSGINGGMKITGGPIFR